VLRAAPELEVAVVVQVVVAAVAQVLVVVVHGDVFLLLLA